MSASAAQANGAEPSASSDAGQADSARPVPDESAPLDPEDEAVLAVLKDKFAEEAKTQRITDVMYIRFVRGYKTEKPRLEKTIERLTEALKWRRENNVDAILEEEMPDLVEMQDMWPSEFAGKDKQGHPVYVERTAKIDPKKVQKLPEGRLQYYHTRVMESLDQLKAKISKESGHMTYKHCAIMDLSGFGMKHCSKKFYGPIQDMIAVDQHSYPESLATLFIINTPWAFKALWAVVGVFVDPLTKKKIKILGSDYMKTISKFVDPSELPEWLADPKAWEKKQTEAAEQQAQQQG